jgi:hypothetical protein
MQKPHENKAIVPEENKAEAEKPLTKAGAVRVLRAHGVGPEKDRSGANRGRLRNEAAARRQAQKSEANRARKRVRRLMAGALVSALHQAAAEMSEGGEA